MAEASSSVRTTVANAKFEVEKFDGTNNFGMWQCEIMVVLCQQELDIFLEEKPDKMDDKEWVKINRQACGTIRLCLAKEQKYSIMRETSANKLWDTREEKFLTKIDLLNLDKKFEDEDKALLLLNSLPDEYDHLTTTLLHGKDTITFDAVCSTLYRSKTQKKDKRNHRDTTAEALTARNCSHNNKPGRRDKSKGRPIKDECAFCREKGHWKKKCPKLQKGKVTSDAFVVEHDEESDFSLVGMAMTCHTDEWILDSGCTYHMCPNKDWFSSLKELEGGVVFMGNDSACKKMGVGTIQLKNHDGSIQVLTDVRYVPSLKKNLILFGALESKGLTITLRDGLLKVVARELMVMKDSEAIRLWHMQLGHAGEKALQTLAKQGLLKGANSCKLEFYEHLMCGDLPKWLLWEKMVETQTGRKVKRLQSDNGTEYKNDPFLQTGKSTTHYDSLHVFGSTAYYHVKESKLDPRAKKALFLGITGGVKGYRLWYPDTRKIVFSKDVTFDESTMLKYKDSQKDDKTSNTLQQVELEKVSNDPANIGGANDEVLTQEPLHQQDSIVYKRPIKEIRKPTRFDDIVACALPIADDDVPSTYTEAISNPDGV
ncbi:hypothetical protein CXB51_018792 [Gossypium anomalum]|uniref:CCHC-type domain-containing protein n=1 Tax=Gossypium anomalum TaxID=47600 RepID=A0A8J5YST5_9ROSI|nr:hypothetical protein CXB51_018792 [Gossypium anomalum]